MLPDECSNQTEIASYTYTAGTETQTNTATHNDSYFFFGWRKETRTYYHRRLPSINSCGILASGGNGPAIPYRFTFFFCVAAGNLPVTVTYGRSLTRLKRCPRGNARSTAGEDQCAHNYHAPPLFQTILNLVWTVNGDRTSEFLSMRVVSVQLPMINTMHGSVFSVQKLDGMRRCWMEKSRITSCVTSFINYDPRFCRMARQRTKVEHNTMECRDEWQFLRRKNTDRK